MIPERPKMIDFEPGEYPLGQFDSVELKYDGHYAQLLFDNGKMMHWARSGNLRRTIDLSSRFALIEPTLLYGEFIFGTQWAKSRDDYGMVAVFGADTIGGCDVSGWPLQEVRAALSVLLRSSPVAESLMYLVDQFPISEAASVWEEYVSSGGFEGLTFKNSNESFCSPMGRMKTLVTVDYVVMDFEDSESDTYEGIGVKSVHGGLYVDGELVHVCKVGGLTAEQREEFYNNPDKYIGMVFEASGKKLFKSGSLRHPNFVRLRPDKLPEECILPK